MKAIKSLLTIGVFISTFSAFAQTSDWNLGGNSANGTDFLGTTNHQFLRISTENTFRMKINPSSINYAVNGFTQNKDGFTLIGRNTEVATGGRFLYDNTWGPYSLLHLNGDRNYVEEWGHRGWMHTGITFTGNRDMSYIGLRKLSNDDDEEDITETTIAWTDNNGSNGWSSDDLQFRFIAGNQGGVNNLSTADDLDGLHIARFTATGKIGFGNTFGMNASGMTPTVPYVAPQNLLHMSLSGNQPVFLQITNRDDAGGTSGTGETASDGLYLGLPTTATNNKPGIFSNRENDRLLFRTNDLGTNNDGERMRIMHTGALNAGVTFPGTLAENFTRVSISHNPANPVTRPMSLLHLGYNVDNPTSNDGWRNWMDVGTFMSRATDHLYVGMKDESNGSDAVLGWGDNNLPDGAGPDNFRMIFTTPLGVGLGQGNTANGLEGLRMTPTILQGINTGIGGDPSANLYSGGSSNPTATLEVNAWGGGNNTSGLRFTNLNSTATPGANPGAGVLSVNPAGDVIYVEANNTPAIGNYCSDPQTPLNDNYEVPLNGFTYNFTAGTQQNDQSKVAIGNIGCGASPLPARLYVQESETMDNTMGNVAIVGSTDATNLPGGMGIIQYGVAGMVSNSSTLQNSGVFGLSSDGDNSAFPNNQSWGYGVTGIAQDNYNNVGVLGSCVAANNNNYGVRGEAEGADFNYAIWGDVSNSTTGTNYAGYFNGDVYITGNTTINGNGWVNGSSAITSDKRFKSEIKPITNALEIVNKLKPSSYLMDTHNPYKLNFADTKQYGFIAQEVEEILPELVHTNFKPQSYDKNGKLSSDSITYKGVEYNGFISIMIAALQEQQKEIKNKDVLLNAMNERLTKLENCISQLNLCNTNSSNTNNTNTGNELQESPKNVSATSVKLSDPQSIVLNQNVPNPFAEKTGISYFLPKSVKNAKIIFHNQDGKFVNSVELTERGNGTINVYADDLSSGIYTYTLIADDKVIDTKKMVKN